MTTVSRSTGPIVVHWSEPARLDQVGGKGYALRELLELGMPVPRWIVLTTDAASLVLAPFHERIEALIRTVPIGDAEAARHASACIAELHQEAVWPTALRQELRQRLGTLQTGRGLAVRSSAVGEDSAESSYAGQLMTLLGVAQEGVEAAVQGCWAAAYSERAILYRQARGLSHGPLRIAIVIQEMLHSRVSGVAFTADPVTGAPAHVVVAGYGLGEGVVADLVETDTFIRELDATSWRSTLGHKTRMAVRRHNGKPGSEIAAVPIENRDRPALSAVQLEALSSVLKRIEEHAGHPQDIEWAFDEEGGLWILQARPISPVPVGDLAIWDDSNIGESYPGLTLPLTYSYVRFVYERLFGRALREVGASWDTVATMRPILGHLVGIIRGRLYFNLLHFYHLFCLVPGLASTARKWETAFGITQHFDLARLREKRSWPRSCGWLLRLRTRCRVALRFVRLNLAVRRFHERVHEMIRRYGDMTFSRRPLDELLQIYERINEEFLDGWTLLIFNDLFAFLFADRLARLCSGTASDLEHLGNGTDLHHRLLCGLAGMDSVAPVRSLVALAEAARQAPAVTTLLRSDRPAAEVWAQLHLCSAAAPFRAQAAAYLHRYGQRTIEERKLEAKPLSDTPWLLVSLLRNALDTGTCMANVEGRARSIREVAEREFRGLFHGNPFKKRYALWVLKRARQCVSDRENMSYARCRAYGVLRRLFRAVGEGLVSTGALQEADDVFYLRVEELEAYARGSLPESELAPLVALRRAQYRIFALEALPHRIACRGSVYSRQIARSGAVQVPGAGDVLYGVPCSPGLVRGIARVLQSPSPAERVDGEILVAPVTDPGWVFLMLAAKGLVVERGSILSHAAIIGRELGVPTIVGAEGATTWIASGDEIEMNGGSGEIRLLQRKRCT